MEKKDILFDSEFLKKIEQLRINSRILMSTTASGNRKSKAKGSSVEFSDYREYSIGDDFRRIDWNAYGRFDKLFIKLFMEEREARVNIFVDTSKSMDWGEPNKGVQARRLAAALSYISLSNFDRVSVIAVNNRLVSSIRSVHTKEGFWKVLEYLENMPYEGTTALNKAIREFDGGGGAGISIIISDFLSFDGIKDAIKYLQYKKQDVFLCHILSPEELSPAVGGSIRLVDVETGEARDVTITHGLLKAYQRALDSFIYDIREFCLKRGIKYVQLCSDLSMENMILMTVGEKP
ncbi:MAG: DUF58 domain-containing protein [Clostridiaceae bacterium]|nr:DUF58 domain-containing protein [Clostridiaceae bacterium]